MNNANNAVSAAQATPAADQELDSRLAVVQEAVSALANPYPLVEEIEAGLDYLAEENADPEAVDAIHRSAITLLDSQQRLAAAFSSAMELARALKDQREVARKSLADLKAALDDADTDVPEIQRLWEMIEESTVEWMMYSMFDPWEKVVEELINTTPLEEEESSSLIAILTAQGDLDFDHYLWDELRDWIRRAQVTIETGICPEPEAS